MPAKALQRPIRAMTRVGKGVHHAIREARVLAPPLISRGSLGGTTLYRNILSTMLRLSKPFGERRFGKESQRNALNFSFVNDQSWPSPPFEEVFADIEHRVRTVQSIVQKLRKVLHTASRHGELGNIVGLRQNVPLATSLQAELASALESLERAIALPFEDYIITDAYLNEIRAAAEYRGIQNVKCGDRRIICPPIIAVIRREAADKGWQIDLEGSSTGCRCKVARIISKTAQSANR